MIKRKGGGGGVIGAITVRGISASISNYHLGKGLREPCSPNREVYVFGSPFNGINADNWNCVAEIIDPTTSFDLSGMAPEHEVAVALLVVHDLQNEAQVSIEWHRDRDQKLLSTFQYTIPDPADYGYIAWDYYVYSYVGYCSWEISENGAYRAFLTMVSDYNDFNRLLQFTVTGIAEAPPPPPGEEKNWLPWIIGGAAALGGLVLIARKGK